MAAPLHLTGHKHNNNHYLVSMVIRKLRQKYGSATSKPQGPEAETPMSLS